MAVGTAAKALFMGVVISMILIPNLIPAAMEGENGRVSDHVFRDTVDHGADRKRLCVYSLDSVKKSAGTAVGTKKF